MTNLGFIGTGKIASAIVTGLCESNIKNMNINLSPRNKNISTQLANKYPNVNRLINNQLVLDESEIIFLSIRPDDSTNILKCLNFNKYHNIVSLIPSITISQLENIIINTKQISRAIPLPTVANHNCPIPLFNSDKTISNIFNYLGKPLHLDDENQLHYLWTLTGFISPFYNLLNELSDWSSKKGVNEHIAKRYITEMYFSLLSSTILDRNIDFNKIVKNSETPNGMNEQARKEIIEKGTHKVFSTAADNLFKHFFHIANEKYTR